MKHDYRPYLNPVFVETGSSNGHGIIGALASGFKQIHSIELSPYYFNICKDMFEDHTDRVHLYLGDSVKLLPSILPTINERCTFWLDAHWCGEKTAGRHRMIPLMEELKIIARHRIKEHTIMIDDIRMIRDKSEIEWSLFPYTEQDLIDFMLSINPHYTIMYDVGVEANDILIARYE